jgi:hypothetical protein
MNKILSLALLWLMPYSAFCQDDVIPLVVPAVPVPPETAAATLSAEARAKLNVEWMFNNISGLESERTSCLIQLNKAYLDSFALAGESEAKNRREAQERAVEQRETALKECLGNAAYEVLKELREKNNYKPGIAAKAGAASAPAPAAPAKAPNTKKSKTPAVNTPPTEPVAPAELSDRLEGEDQP